MKMTFRWFGENHDSIRLEQIRQIPGITGVVTSFLDIPAGEAWPCERIRTMKETVNAAGLEVQVIESVNVHEDIKLGLSSRDAKIENYILTMERLAEHGIQCICYNMMPVLDWARSELYYPLPDGSNTMRYEAAFMERITPEKLAARYLAESAALPGWEPERLAKIRGTLAAYEGYQEKDFYDNMKYFLDAVIPHAARLGIKMAVHPDDPPQPIFGLPKLIISRDNIRKYLDLHPSEYNGLTLCTGSLGARKGADIPGMIREFGSEGRIHFAHVRNLKFENETDFYESAHLSSCGSLDMYEIMKAFSDTNFTGWMRPDHGRMIWNECARRCARRTADTVDTSAGAHVLSKPDLVVGAGEGLVADAIPARPGYGLYDRALGATYLQGLWEALAKG